MQVLYPIRPYFVGIFPYIGLIYGRYLQFRYLKLPLNVSPSRYPYPISLYELADRFAMS